MKTSPLKNISSRQERLCQGNMAIKEANSEIQSRTHHMLVSLWGSKWREVYMGYFTVFLDDSGTSPEHKVAISAALIIPAARIIAFEREWETLKRKEGFNSFHTSEFAARNPKSEFAGWDDEKHERVFTRVRQIIKIIRGQDILIRCE